MALAAQDAIPPGWQDILDPGEAILWQGQPEAALDWAGLIRPQTLQGLFLAGFAVFWISLAFWMTRQGAGAPPLFQWVFPLFGLPLLFAGLNTAFGTLIRGHLRLRGSFYTLSDRNAFIATTLRGKRHLTRLPLGPGLIPALEEGDPGSVWLAAPAAPQTGWRGTGIGGTYFGLNAGPDRSGFERIRDARRVYRLILDAQAALAARQDAAAPTTAPDAPPVVPAPPALP